MHLITRIAAAGGASLALAMASTAASAQNTDAQGCWIVPPSCTPIESGRSDDGLDDLMVTVFNKCEANIYVTVCLDMHNGRSNCGSFDVAPGESNHFGISDRLTTGTYRYQVTGSAQSNYDYVCHQRQYPGGLR